MDPMHASSRELCLHMSGLEVALGESMLRERELILEEVSSGKNILVFNVGASRANTLTSAGESPPQMYA